MLGRKNNILCYKKKTRIDEIPYLDNNPLNIVEIY